MERFQVELLSCPRDEIKFVKALRIIGRISLADAVAIHAEAREAGGMILVAGIERAVAEHIAESFDAADIQTVVQPSSVATPMVCRPQANTAYRWTGWRSIVKID